MINGTSEDMVTQYYVTGTSNLVSTYFYAVVTQNCVNSHDQFKDDTVIGAHPQKHTHSIIYSGT